MLEITPYVEWMAFLPTKVTSKKSRARARLGSLELDRLRMRCRTNSDLLLLLLSSPSVHVVRAATLPFVVFVIRLLFPHHSCPIP